jgi:hypothetical protein
VTPDAQISGFAASMQMLNPLLSRPPYSFS